MQFATRCRQLIGGKRHAAPVAASLKSGSQLNVERCADGIKSIVGRGAYSRGACLTQLPLRSPENMLSDPCDLRGATAARKCVVHVAGVMEPLAGRARALKIGTSTRLSRRYIVNVVDAAADRAARQPHADGVLDTSPGKTQVRAPETLA